MAETSIEWTQRTWNPIRGCTRISEGCRHCYAEGIAARFSKPGLPYEGLARRVGGEARWTGEVMFVEGALLEPLRRHTPTTWFVNSMSDLFHEKIPDAWIERIFAVMALCPQHTFQCLTKRPARMRAYLSGADRPVVLARTIDALSVDREHDPVEHWAAIPGYPAYEASSHGAVRSSARDRLAVDINPLHGREQVTLWNSGQPRTWFVHALVLMAHRGLPEPGQEARHRNGRKLDNRLANLVWGSRSKNQEDKVRHGSNGGPAKLTRTQAAEIRARRAAGETQQSIAAAYSVSRSLVSMVESRRVWPDPIAWPLPNVWLGTSCEDQAAADARVPELLATPAAMRFVSAEPLLGGIDFRSLRGSPIDYPEAPRRAHWIDALTGEHGSFLATSRTVRQDRLGRLDWIIVGGESGRGARPMHPRWARSIRDQCAAVQVAFFFKQHGAWLFEDQVRDGQHPGAHFFRADGSPVDEKPPFGPAIGRLWHWWDDDGGFASVRVGKAVAGRLLDGRSHDAMPEVRHG